MDPTERLPPEIWREIIWNLRKPYHQGIICGLRWKENAEPQRPCHCITALAAVIEPFLFKDLHLRIDKVLGFKCIIFLTQQRLSYIRSAAVKCGLASHICKRSKRCTLGPGDCAFRQHHLKDEIEFNDIVYKIFGILKDLPRREKPYMDMIFEMSRSGFSVTFTQKGCTCGSTDTPTFTPGDMCRLARCVVAGACSANSIVGLARSLDLIPLSVQTLLIDYQREMIVDQTFNPPSLIPIGSNREAFAEAMRPLAPRHGIREITLLASINIAMFQPTTENPCWPIPKSFTFAFCNWVVTGENPLSAEEEECERQETREWVGGLHYCPPGCEIENSFKSYMREGTMDRFLLAAAQAVCHMPKIRKLSVRHVFDPAGFKEDILRGV
ncbi:unnamed protein product [Fusarium fujikuroi]|nr:unnamed protein product [Fusarium fujikuroi]